MNWGSVGYDKGTLKRSTRLGKGCYKIRQQSRYYQSHRLIEKNDVYNFGIVLLEIIPVGHTRNRVESRLKSGGTSIVVDTKLCGHYDINSARKMLEIAMACTSASSMRRLIMSIVVIKLKECFQMDVTGETNDS
ncbi:hypothetical protein Taro_045228, partial [Colocasia esculenta]|nr:hypothetical protein [Colocasia esculenta]